MSGRNGVGQIRGAALGPQPLKATVPYQLAIKPRPHRRDGKSAGKARPHQLSSGMRRTVSLDAIIGTYLQGQWPKEPEGPSSPSHKDKSTQTPDSWSDKTQSRRGSSSGHKRSASWGSAENLREVNIYSTQPIPIPLAPLSTLVPRLRCSLEGLNQELEGMFICQPPHPQHRVELLCCLLEVPDGHRAPVPPQSCSSGSQSDYTTTPLSSSSLSSSPSPSPTYNSTFPPNSEEAALDMHQDLIGSGEVCLPSAFTTQSEADLSAALLVSSSPGPNKSCCFQREPPEGCEKVRVWEETRYPTLISSCPDPNKVNFTPHGGSAFCPVSLLKPLLPSMDLLFRSLTVSPAGGCSSQGSSAGSRSTPTDSAVTSGVMAENSGQGLAF
uniref:Uncharacterized protein n=1 Tax=Mola mola TaxID=94237 RepID=A0A3Q3VS55_MOLML